MNTAQNRMYWAEWKKAETTLIKLGRLPPNPTKAQTNTLRAELHAQAEAPPSSSQLNNAHFDRVIALFRSYSQPDNLLAQLDPHHQDSTRFLYLANDILDRINAHLETLDRPQETIPQGTHREAYLLYLARRISANPDLTTLENLTTTQWTKLIALLNYRQAQVTRKHQGRGAKRPRPYDKTTPKNPF